MLRFAEMSEMTHEEDQTRQIDNDLKYNGQTEDFILTLNAVSCNRVVRIISERATFRDCLDAI